MDANQGVLELHSTYSCMLLHKAYKASTDTDADTKGH